MFTDADLISSYSRAQALADGVLVAVDSKVAGEAGFRCPLALKHRPWLPMSSNSFSP